MAEILLLKQQLEFLQLELEEAKSRETQLKSMYDSMLKSFSYDSPRLTCSTSVELKSAEERHTQDRMRIKLKYKEKARQLTKENQQLQDEKSDLESKLNESVQDLASFKAFSQSEIFSIKTQWAESEKNSSEAYDSMQKAISRKNEIITRLKNEIEEVKQENGEEIRKITEETSRSLLELKEIYEKEKGKTENQLKEENKRQQETIKNLENSESDLKEIVRIKDDQIDKISRKLRIKASEDSKSHDFKDFTSLKESLSEKLIDKEIEITKLKKIIGELKLEIANSASKPPIYSPKTYRSMTFISKIENTTNDSFSQDLEDNSSKKFERMISQVLLMQCNKCLKSYNKDLFYEHILNCESETDRSLSEGNERVRELEKTSETLKLSLANMKTQRDKFKIECEKLLMQLKQTKLDWAISEELAEDRYLDVKSELKKVLELVLKAFRHLPESLKHELSLFLKKNEHLFSSKAKSFAQ